jgi:hypothetical protein
MIEVREYADPHGRSPFQQWFEALDARAAAKVTVALTRDVIAHLQEREGVQFHVQPAREKMARG